MPGELVEDARGEPPVGAELLHDRVHLLRVGMLLCDDGRDACGHLGDIAPGAEALEPLHRPPEPAALPHPPANHLLDVVLLLGPLEQDLA